ncbi:hypothetical protein [Micromonospora carbonacea]|uniref:hypothetical protein n=1 Tax=Micromonospora carbonacea TaxID=47853 RepID=UPI00159F24D5|nr:hypothetical protein [Micromonospora carbonacea]
MRWPRQVASAAALTTILAGPPIVLARTVGWPLPTRPTQEQLHQWISDPLTENTLIAGLVLLAWTLWALLASIALRATAARVVKAVRRLRRVPLPTPVQATATGMAGAAALWTPTTSAATVDASTPAPTTTGHQTNPHHQQAAILGVDIPGGWLPADTAQQIAAASALVWLRRRRAYQPQPPGQPRDDSDLTPLPPTVTAVQAATPPATRPTPAPTLVLPTGGIGLTGPGAADAARGILLTTLLQALRPTGHPTTAVITSRADLHRLLGAHTPALHHLPGLTATDTLDDAITTLARTNNPSSTPPTLLTHTPTDPTTAARLATALTHTVGVLIGTWTHGSTWHIEADGHTHPDTSSSDRARLCVLTDTAARDLLTVLAPTPAIPPATAVPRQRPPIPAPPLAPSPPKPLTLQVLGNPTLRAGGTPVPIRRSAALQILVAFAAHPEGRTTRELATSIWPGLAPHTVTRRLYTTLSDLRKDITTTGQPNPIEHTNDRYHLNPQHIDVDLWQLNAAIDHAATALTNHTHAYQAIIDHYTGDIAANHTWPWLDPIREKTRRHVIDAHTALADHTPDPIARLHRLQDALRVDPYNEHLHHLAADTLTALGKPQDSRALLARYHQRLAEAAPTRA